MPKDTQILPFLWGVHMDERRWNEPEKFNPERFLDEESRVKQPRNFMPFGTGRRMCLGDVLAKMEVFLFFSSMLHVFDLEKPVEEELPSLDPIIGATFTTKPFKACFKPREVEYSNSYDSCDYGYSEIPHEMQFLF